MNSKPRLFLDTSALFSGIWSAEGGARMLLKLGEAGVVQLLVSPQVLSELDDAMRRKADHLLAALALLLDRSQFTIAPPADDDLYSRCREIVYHPGDARILADAWQNEADYLVTLDQAHFLGVPGVIAQVPFSIGTPGDCLAWLRDMYIIEEP